MSGRLIALLVAAVVCTTQIATAQTTELRLHESRSCGVPATLSPVSRPLTG